MTAQNPLPSRAVLHRALRRFEEDPRKAYLHTFTPLELALLLCTRTLWSKNETCFNFEMLFQELHAVFNGDLKRELGASLALAAKVEAQERSIIWRVTKFFFLFRLLEAC
jgi:hypothetical protein